MSRLQKTKTEVLFRLKETKEMWQLNAMCNPELDPGSKLVGHLAKLEWGL